MYIRITIYILLLLVATGGIPGKIFAQTPSEVLSNTISLSLVPAYPGLGEEFTATLGGYGVVKTGVRWFINGREDSESRNKDSITLQASTIAVATTIEAVVATSNNITVTKKYVVTPKRVDLIVTANTLVPPFYKGRSLPSSGSTITATAFVFSGGASVTNAYSYLWKVNGKAQTNTAGKGNSTFTFTPNFEKNILLSVDVQDQQGKIVAQKSQSIPIVQPELYFYEQNPLRGLSYTALRDPYIFVGDEMTIRAEGYFMNPTLRGTNILRQWSIGNKTVTTQENDPQEITVSKDGNSGSSKLSFHIRNLQQLLQGVEKSITITF